MQIYKEASIHHLIHTLRHGHYIWFPFKEVSFRQLQFLVAGIFGLGMGVAGLIVWKDGSIGYSRGLPWTSERRDSPKNLCLIAGLQNLGNNCFLNVIVQALASCCCFHPFLQSVIEANDSMDMRKVEEDLPLTVALVAVLKELCIFRDERVVVSPRTVMSAMRTYVSSFNLTRQQDAAEAFVHLLSSLKEEISESYVPCYGSLANISSPVGRIYHPEGEGESEWERWQQRLFGPFDGTLGSILSCKSCSFQVSMDFEFFHCLPLSPITDRSGSIIDGCTVEECLKQFTASEHIEDFRCNQCLHIAAAKYLSLNVEENETKIKKLGNCIKHDSCDCKNLLLSEGMPWPTGYSCAFKQLSIGRCPKIFCIHLQRASVTDSGELVKLQGHISFPLVLDFFPFTAAAIGMEVPERDTLIQVKQQQLSASHLNYFQMQMLPHVYGLVGKHIPSEDKLGSSIYKSSGDSVNQTCEGESFCIKGDSGDKAQIPDLVYKQPCFKSKYTDPLLQNHNEFNKSYSMPLKNYIYRLVSVVEHYGRVGSGHYAVYRRVKASSDADDSEERTVTSDAHWFYVSDAEVLSVSEEAVLAAEASLLFYERIEVST